LYLDVVWCLHRRPLFTLVVENPYRKKINQIYVSINFHETNTWFTLMKLNLISLNKVSDSSFINKSNVIKKKQISLKMIG